MMLKNKANCYSQHTPQTRNCIALSLFDNQLQQQSEWGLSSHRVVPLEEVTHAINKPAEQFEFLFVANPGMLAVADNLWPMASTHAPHCVSCSEEHFLTSHVVLPLRVTIRSVQHNLCNNSSAGPKGRDPHVRHNEEAHNTKPQPGTHLQLIIGCRRVCV